MKRWSWVCLALAAALAHGQDVLTIEEALTTARENNGDVRSAYLSVLAAEQDVKSAKADFLPSVSANLSRSSGWQERYTGFNQGRTDFNSTNSSVSLDYQILDSGQRRYSFDRVLLSQDVALLSARQTLRSTLFTVHQRFYDALRSQELFRVRSAQLKRSEELLKQAEISADPAIGAIPRKDVLQARADLLNSRASVLQAQNNVSTSLANLKAVLGWNNSELPELDPQTDPSIRPEERDLESLVNKALDTRPDLVAQRKRVEQSQVALRLTKLNVGVQYSLNAQYTRTFNEDVSDRPQLVFSASLPVYDGDSRRATVRGSELSLEAQLASLQQTERDVVAEVESAYKSYAQNGLILEASQLALQAAQENYDAASKSLQLGAGDVIDVLTAQVTLVTAETNFVQSLYDLLISEVRLDLAVGDPIPGEPTDEPVDE